MERVQVQGQASPRQPGPPACVSSPWSACFRGDTLPPPQATRQALSERLGRGSRTVDLDLESRLQLLQEQRRRYEGVARLAQTLANQLSRFAVTQRSLGDAFSELGLRTPPLHVSPAPPPGPSCSAPSHSIPSCSAPSCSAPSHSPPHAPPPHAPPPSQVEFSVNADAQWFLSKSGKTLADAIGVFTADVDTLIHKTMEDTFINARQYEATRSVHFLSDRRG